MSLYDGEFMRTVNAAERGSAKLRDAIFKARGYRPIVVPKPARIIPTFDSILRIQAAVASHYGIDGQSFRSPSKLWDITRPRQVAMYLARHLTGKSLPVIARHFDRDHTTVIHAVRRIEQLRSEDQELDNDIRLLTRQLEG